MQGATARTVMMEQKLDRIMDIYIYITWYHKFPVIFYWKIQHIYLQTLSSFSNECALCTLVQEKILVNKCVIGSDLVMRKGRRWVFY
jgi:hypothetical protein